MAAATAVLASPLIAVLFGDRWRGAAPVMVAVALASAVSTSTFALGDLLKAVGRQRFIVILNLIDIPPLIIGTLFAAHHGGITAVAWVILVLQVWFGILLAACARPAMQVSWRTIGRPFLPGVATAIGVAAAGGAVRIAYPANSLPALCAGGVACAGGGLIALRVLARDTFTDLRRQLSDLVPSRGGAPRRVTFAPPSSTTGAPPDAARPLDQAVGSPPMPEDPLQSPNQSAREAGRQIVLVIEAEAKAEAAAVRAASGHEVTSRRGAAIGEARQIVDLARITGEEVATAIDNVATTTAKLETSVAALRGLSAGPIPGGLDGRLDAGSAIGPVVARAAADAEALVRGASADAERERGVAIADAQRIAEIARDVSRSSQKVVGRLQRLAAATARLQTSALALSEASLIDGAPPSLETASTSSSPAGATPLGDGDGPAAVADPPGVVDARSGVAGGPLPAAAPASGSSAAEFQAARHVALGLAVAGTPREDVARHLRDTLHLENPDPVLDLVFGRARPDQGRGSW